MDADRMVQALQAAVASFNEGIGAPERGEAYFELYDESVVLHGYPEGVEGLAGAREFYTSLLAALGDGELSGEDVIPGEDRLAVRFRLRGTHSRGELLGIPPAGAQIDVGGQTILRFGPSGKVVERWQNMDDLGLLTQRGAVSAPV